MTVTKLGNDIFLSSMKKAVLLFVVEAIYLQFEGYNATSVFLHDKTRHLDPRMSFNIAWGVRESNGCWWFTKFYGFTSNIPTSVLTKLKTVQTNLQPHLPTI
jgi:hypothetical protein